MRGVEVFCLLGEETTLLSGSGRRDSGGKMTLLSK